MGILTLGISRLPLGSPETKCHLDVSSVAKHRIYYKGEGGGFLQVWAVVSFVSPSLPMVHPSTKSVLAVMLVHGSVHGLIHDGQFGHAHVHF